MSVEDAVRWIGRLDEAIAPYPSGAAWEATDSLRGPVVWIARHADADGWSLPPPEAPDLADAALAKRVGGAGRVLRRRMLRALAARLLAVHPASLRFTRAAGGAPGLDGLDAHVSTAGCEAEDGGWSAVAIARRPVGVDLEPGAPTDACVRWTLAEAYLKALGQGLTVPPEQVRLTRTADGWRARLAPAPPGHGSSLTARALTAACMILD